MKTPFLLSQVLKFLYPLIKKDEYKRVSWIILLSLFISGLELTLALSFANLAQVLNGSVNPEYSNLFLSTLDYLSQLIWSELESHHALLLMSLATLVSLLLLRATLQLIYQWYLGFFSESLGQSCRLKIFKFYQHAPSLWLNESGLAELNFNVASSTTVATIAAQSLHLLSNTFILSLLLFGLIFSNQKPSIVFVILLGIAAFCIIRFLRKVIKRSAQNLVDIELEISQLTYDTLSGVEALRLAQKESFIFGRFKQSLQKLLKLKLKQNLLSRLPTLSLEFFGFLSLFLCALFYTYIDELSLSTISGTLTLLAAIAWRSLPLINQSLNTYTALRVNLPYLERVNNLIELKHKFTDQSLMVDSHSMSINKQSVDSQLDFKRAIQLNNLSFRYPNSNKLALDTINLTINYGQNIAVIGDSGAGKSTLLHLLVGLLKKESGQIIIDEQELSLRELSSWLPQVGYVPQKAHLFDLSLQENIGLRDWGSMIDIKKVEQCCQLAHIDFVPELQEGFQTKLGEAGYSLSGGQAQRVALARALYHDPQLLILDEASNAIDNHTEFLILQTLLQNKSLTLIFISHRLESCVHFDQVIWLKEGSVFQVGPPKAILTEYKKYLHLKDLNSYQQDAHT